MTCPTAPPGAANMDQAAHFPTRRSIAVHPGTPQAITGLSRFCALIGNRAQLVFHVQGRAVDPLAINCECMPGFARAL